MKLPATAAAALIGLISQAGALSFDFTGSGLVGTTVDQANPVTVTVLGYGDLRFSVEASGSGTIDTNYGGGEESLEIDPGETIIVDFLDQPVHAVVFDFVGVTPGAEGVIPNAVSPHQSRVTLIALGGGADGAGLENLRFLIVPESSTTLLAALASILLFRRRRR